MVVDGAIALIIPDWLADYHAVVRGVGRVPSTAMRTSIIPLLGSHHHLHSTTAHRSEHHRAAEADAKGKRNPQEDRPESAHACIAAAWRAVIVSVVVAVRASTDLVVRANHYYQK